VEVGEGTGIDDEEVFEAFGATHGSRTAGPGEDVVGRNRLVDGSHIPLVDDLLKITAYQGRVGFC
jgi:hypothetical protein